MGTGAKRCRARHNPVAASNTMAMVAINIIGLFLFTAGRSCCCAFSQEITGETGGRAVDATIKLLPSLIIIDKFLQLPQLAEKW
jgi:hypothetical protein